ncbi:MAG: leucyl/phenylalanyl-tRNA--protein transferase, partial [Pseudomonadota bacterium]|nr:leucyl/phenylalanyl-tRNA--protein transferase [Pseudomonadota bacterium]
IPGWPGPVSPYFPERRPGHYRPRKNQDGESWITPDMIDAYIALFRQGYAHSVEVWLDGVLVGGLYGVALGTMFFGESMFSSIRDASKIALVALARQLDQWGYKLIDCQVPSHHLSSMGAKLISRREFANQVAQLVKLPGKTGYWGNYG